MKQTRLIVLATLLTLVVSVVIASASIATSTGEYVLDFDDFHHIVFDNIEPNIVEPHEQQLVIRTDSSASFLMMPFDEVQTVNSVSVNWSAKGRPAVQDAEHEASKAGDDAVLKLALLLEGRRADFEFLLPAWVKKVRSLLMHESNKMLYLVADARHSATSRWVSPYSSSIEMVAMRDSTDGSGARLSTFEAEEPLRVVGLWLMVDSDNTHSRFVTRVNRIVLGSSIEDKANRSETTVPE